MRGGRTGWGARPLPPTGLAGALGACGKKPMRMLLGRARAYSCGVHALPLLSNGRAVRVARHSWTRHETWGLRERSAVFEIREPYFIVGLKITMKSAGNSLMDGQRRIFDETAEVEQDALHEPEAGKHRFLFDSN